MAAAVQKQPSKKRKGKAIGGNWVETKDDEGRTYYANVLTRTVTWTRPSADQLKDDAEQERAEDEEKEEEPEDSGQGKGKGKGKKPDVWLERQDPRTGNTYYYNPAKGQTALHRPTGETVTTGVLQMDEDAGKGAWVERIDPKSKRPYYYNPILQQTSWTNPDEEEKKREKAKELANQTQIKRLSHKVGASAANAKQRLSQRLSGVFQSATGGGGDRASTRYSLAIPKLPTNKTAARASIRFGAAKTIQDEEGNKTTTFEPISEDRFAKLRAMKNKDVLLGDLKEGAEGSSLHIDIDALVDEIDWLFDPAPFFRYVQSAFSQKRKVDFREIQKFSGKLLKYPLHDISDKNLVHDSKTANKAIMHYMGDYKKNKKSPAHWARILVEHGNGSPEEFKNELFCQLVKQTTENPNQESLNLGWELLAICAGTFLPDPEFMPYLKSHFKDAVENSSSEHVKKMAEYAMLRLEKTRELGDRLEIPSIIEVRAVQKREPLRIRVHLINRTAINIQADTWTTVQDVNAAIEKELGVKDGTPFTVYEVDDEESERVLDDSDRVLDIISYWEREVQKRKTKKYTPSYQFVYKMRLFFDIQEDDVSAVELAYYQAVSDVTDSRYPCSETDAIRLAALEAQEKFGDHQDGSDVFGENLALYVQAKYYDEDSKDHMKDLIYHAYKELKGYTPLEAKLNYLDYVKAWKIYGSAYFLTRPQNTRHTKFPPEVVIAVNAKGVLIVDPESKDFLKEYPYSEIVTWGHSSTTFVLVVGNLIRSRKIFFATDQGLELNSLIHAYVNKLLEVQ